MIYCLVGSTHRSAFLSLHAVVHILSPCLPEEGRSTVEVDCFLQRLLGVKYQVPI